MEVLKQLFIEELSPEEIARIETRMRPMAFSIEGFLDHTQNLASVIAKDSATIEKLGITHKQIGDRLESLMGKANRQLELKRRLPDDNNSEVEEEQEEEEVFLITVEGWIGYQYSPFS